MRDKITYKTTLVEIDGDEMTRVLWGMVKGRLILPYVDLKSEYYDLGLLNRNATYDQVTIDAANATRKYGVSVKCATITPNAQRMEEYPELTEMWKSPNATIRAILGGTVFRAPIITKNIAPAVNAWKKPITIARHAYGDVYKASEMITEEPGVATLRFVGESGKVSEVKVEELSGNAILQGMHNTTESIEDFARACFEYSLDIGQDLWFSTKDTISKIYDGTFKAVFDKLYVEEYQEKFKNRNIIYFYTLIDDAVSRVVRSEGGFVWALKNYDGDVMSDMVSTAFGSLAMMTSVLLSPDGCYEYEAAHGTVTKHYYRYKNGEEPSTNPVATIFAWSGALRKRGELDGVEELQHFADKLEKAVIDTIEAGEMTGDLSALASGNVRTLTSAAFIDTVAKRLDQSMLSF